MRSPLRESHHHRYPLKAVRTYEHCNADGLILFWVSVSVFTFDISLPAGSSLTPTMFQGTRLILNLRAVAKDGNGIHSTIDASEMVFTSIWSPTQRQEMVEVGTVVSTVDTRMSEETRTKAATSV